MNAIHFRRRQGGAIMLSLPVLFCSVALCVPATARAAKTEVVPKWDRLELVFKSSSAYENPFQDCKLTATFVSPSGKTNSVDGFWDGGRTWRVRFSPGQPGHWTYRTWCSDFGNDGLDNQSGEFICSAPVGLTRFDQHGPVRLAADHRHFEHADGTPFFWLADSAWGGPRFSSERDWEGYAAVRASQKFSAVQWSVIGPDSRHETAFTGSDRIAVNPDFFQRLDGKVKTLNEVGLLSVMAPSWLRSGQTLSALPESQLALLFRYMVARWGANDVAWLLVPLSGTTSGWRSAAETAFHRGTNSPVILLANDVDDVADMKWVDAYGYTSGQNPGDDGWRKLVARLGSEETPQSGHALVDVIPPYENAASSRTGERISADDMRRVTWQTLLAGSAAGASYGADGVAYWNTTPQDAPRGTPGRGLPVWQLSLFLPGAKQAAEVMDFFNSIPFWNLKPASDVVAGQSNSVSPDQFIAAAETGSKDLAVVYVPDERRLELNLNALPSSPTVQWFNPRTGQRSPAVAVVGGSSFQVPTPGPGDWVLVIKKGK